MVYVMTRMTDGEEISPFCRIFRTPRNRLLTPAALDGTVYVRTVGRFPDTLTADVILNGDGKKAILEEAFRSGAEVCFSADENTVSGVITQIVYLGDKFAGVRRAEVTLSEVESG